MKKSPARRIDRFAFERLLADLAARFADVRPDEVRAQIEHALERLVQFFGYDRCTYSEFTRDGVAVVIASAAMGKTAPHRLGPFDPSQTWFLGELRAGRPVVLPALPEGLPAHARAEAEHVKRAGLRSHLSIPLRARGRTTGVLSFAGFRKARDWPADLIVRLTIIADVFASAVSRARTEEEAGQLRSRVWHADRVARVSALTAAIAHEINQPLAAILSNAQAGLAWLGRGEAPPEEMREVLEAVVRDDKRAADIIRTMRGFLRQDESSRARIDLAEALEDVLRLLGAELARKGVRIEARLEPGCWVRADRIQIEQVALNLVLNAAQAMESCPPEERVVRLHAGPAAAGRVAVEVRDAGAGIAPGELASVFEPFWSTRKDGLGLGLPICRSIVEAHGGAIQAQPNAQRGMTFRFELPGEAAAATPPAPQAALPAMRPEPAAAAGVVVCVVDDDATVRESLARLLRAEGWTPATYASAEAFLERQPLGEVGCILLDHQMPGMSGLQLQRALAERGAAPPIVFLTGHGELTSGVQAMKLGALDFLTKPADAGVLVQVVRKALARAAERAALAARLARLSAREREVMEHVLRGRLNKQIAADLDIAIQTVKQHRGRVMEKMEVRSVAELAKLCALLEPAAEREV